MKWLHPNTHRGTMMKTALRKAVCKYGSGLLLGLPALAGPALADDAPAAAPELTSNIGVV